MTESPTPRDRKGPLLRATIAGVLAAAGVALGVSADDLRDTGSRSAPYQTSPPRQSQARSP
jgi:hypothetical protein